MKKNNIRIFFIFLFVVFGCGLNENIDNKTKAKEVRELEKNNLNTNKNEIEEKHELVNGKEIEGYVLEVDNEIENYKEEGYNDLLEEPKEGEQIYRLAMINMKRYNSNEKLKKIVVDFNGDREDLISSYYFYKNEPVYVVKEKTVFNKPKWDDNFNKEKKENIKSEYYLNNYKIIKSENKEEKNIDDIEEMIKDDVLMYSKYKY